MNSKVILLVVGADYPINQVIKEDVPVNEDQGLR